MYHQKSQNKLKQKLISGTLALSGLFGSQSNLTAQTIPYPQDRADIVSSDNLRVENNSNLPEQPSQENISTESIEAHKIHQILTGPAFNLPKFPLIGASFNESTRSFGYVKTLEYQPSSGLDIIDTPYELDELAKGVAGIYHPQTIDPNAFENLATSSGVEVEFAKHLEGAGVWTNHDMLAQFIAQYNYYRNQGMEFVPYRNNGVLIVSGSQDSIVDVKTVGRNGRPPQESAPLADFLQSLFGWVSGQGFKSADYTRNDINRFPEQGMGYLQSSVQGLQINPIAYFTPNSAFTLEDSLRTVGPYGNLPGQKLNVVWLEGGYMNLRNLDTTGPLNNFADEINGLEQRIIDSGDCGKTRRNRLTLGYPSSGFVSPLSHQNQLSARSGLVGIESYSESPNNQFYIAIEETTGVGRGFQEQAKFQVTVAFGQQAFNAVQNRRDRLFLLHALEDATFGFAVGGPLGAALGGAKSGIDGTWAYFEGKNPPNATLMSDDRDYVSALPTPASNVYSILNNAKETGANGLIVVNYPKSYWVNEPAHPVKVSEGPCGVLYQMQQGNSQLVETCNTGVIYTKNAYNIRVAQCGDVVCFDTDLCGANHLYSLLYEGVMRASLIGTREIIRKQIVEKPHHDKPHGGGHMGGPGGKGDHAGGGRNDGPGGMGGKDHGGYMPQYGGGRIGGSGGMGVPKMDYGGMNHGGNMVGGNNSYSGGAGRSGGGGK